MRETWNVYKSRVPAAGYDTARLNMPSLRRIVFERAPQDLDNPTHANHVGLGVVDQHDRRHSEGTWRHSFSSATTVVPEQ